MTLNCPHCGGAISVQILVQSAVQTGANQGANGEIAQKTLDLEPAVRRRSYNQGYMQEFVQFWSVYPLKRNKRKAYLAWQAAVRRLGANPGATLTKSEGAIMAGAIRYRDDPNRSDEYTQHAATWLNGDGWEDEALPHRGTGQRPDPPRSMTAGDMDVAWEIERSRDA